MSPAHRVAVRLCVRGLQPDALKNVLAYGARQMSSWCGPLVRRSLLLMVEWLSAWARSEGAAKLQPLLARRHGRPARVKKGADNDGHEGSC